MAGGRNETNSTDQASPEAPAYFTEQRAHVNRLQVRHRDRCVWPVKPWNKCGPWIPDWATSLARHALPLHVPDRTIRKAVERGPIVWLQEQLNKVSKAAHIVSSHKARGPAKQILPDSSFLSTLPLQQAFVECAQRARTRNANRKASSMKALVTINRARVEFTGAARNTISPALLQLIRCISSLVTGQPFWLDVWQISLSRTTPHRPSTNDM